MCSLHILGSYITSVQCVENIGMIMRAKVFTSYISTWILYVKGISLAPWQHMMSRLLPATILFQGYFRQHQGSKPFKDSNQKQTPKWLWIKQIYFIQSSLKNDDILKIARLQMLQRWSRENNLQLEFDVLCISIQYY